MSDFLRQQQQRSGQRVWRMRDYPVRIRPLPVDSLMQAPTHSKNHGQAHRQEPLNNRQNAQLHILETDHPLCRQFRPIIPRQQVLHRPNRIPPSVPDA